MRRKRCRRREPNTSTADILKAIHPECKGVTAEQATMTALDAAMSDLEVTEEA